MGSSSRLFCEFCPTENSRTLEVREGPYCIERKLLKVYAFTSSKKRLYFSSTLKYQQIELWENNETSCRYCSPIQNNFFKVPFNNIVKIMEPTPWKGVFPPPPPQKVVPQSCVLMRNIGVKLKDSGSFRTKWSTDRTKTGENTMRAEPEFVKV